MTNFDLTKQHRTNRQWVKSVPLYVKRLVCNWRDCRSWCWLLEISFKIECGKWESWIRRPYPITWLPALLLRGCQWYCHVAASDTATWLPALLTRGRQWYCADFWFRTKKTAVLVVTTGYCTILQPLKAVFCCFLPYFIQHKLQPQQTNQLTFYYIAVSH